MDTDDMDTYVAQSHSFLPSFPNSSLRHTYSKHLLCASLDEDYSKVGTEVTPALLELQA